MDPDWGNLPPGWDNELSGGGNMNPDWGNLPPRCEMGPNGGHLPMMGVNYPKGDLGRMVGEVVVLPSFFFSNLPDFCLVLLGFNEFCLIISSLDQIWPYLVIFTWFHLD